MYDRRNTNKQRGRVRAMSVLGNTKSNRYRKTHQVELGGTGKKSFSTLPGEIFQMRVWKKSAEAVLARKFWKQDGVKGRRTKRQTV
jgi:hypothetical protein